MEPNDISALVLGPAGGRSAPVPDAPRLSAATATPLREIAAIDEQGIERAMHVPIERPLTVSINGRELVTLMTLGAAPEWLVLGYLRNQRLIDEVTDLESVEVDWAESVARVTSRRGKFTEPSTAAAFARAAADGSAAAGGQAVSLGAVPLGCGLGTGFADLMQRLQADEAGGPASRHQNPAISRAALFQILDSMRQHDAIHRAAGSVHSCALFRGGELFAAVEDISRHNGIDTITGFMALHGIEGADKILFTTGRLTGEMVMKAAHNGIPIMISRNGTTAMGYELAARLGMTLIGRAANRRYLCYVGAGRISLESE